MTEHVPPSPNQPPAGEADVIVVFANGACYIVPKADPDRYQTHGSNAMYSMFDEHRSLVFVASEDGDLVAFDQSGCERWARRSFGAFGVVLKSCESGILTGANIRQIVRRVHGLASSGVLLSDQQ